VAQDRRGVQISADGLEMVSERAVVAVPLAIARTLRYDPPLPVEREFLHQRALSGAVTKVVTVYDRPFWRDDGLSGESFSFDHVISLTMDTSPRDARLGVLMCFATGPSATAFGKLSAGERRAAALEAVTARFGRLGAEPLVVFEQDWAKEEFSRGGYMAHFPPGALTRYGHTIAEPWGRVHWAGSETSPVSLGSIDGAIRSGERAAAEVLSALGG
jgi:monoamine oxidase